MRPRSIVHKVNYDSNPFFADTELIEEMESLISSLPVGERLPSAGLALTPVQKKGAGRALDELATALRSLPMPVIGRIADDRLLLDLRCLEDAGLLQAQLEELRRRLRGS